jgi:hypothetical protein
MATFTASAAQSTAPAFNSVNGDITRVVSYNQTASLSIGDVIQMVRVPMGAIVSKVGIVWSVSAGVTGVTIGDGNDVSAFYSNSLISGSIATFQPRFLGVGRSYSAEDTIDISIFSVSATPANAALTLTVTYSMQN